MSLRDTVMPFSAMMLTGLRVSVIAGVDCIHDKQTNRMVDGNINDTPFVAAFSRTRLCDLDRAGLLTHFLLRAFSSTL